MIRRFGENVVNGQRYKLRPGAYAVLHRGRSVLLTYQAEPEHEFQLPGGGIDPGEQIVPALHREILEETGWRVTNLRRVGAFRRFVYMPDYDMWAEKICQVYSGHPVRRLHPPLEPHHSETWASFDDAPHLIENDGDRHFLRAILRAI